MAKYTNIGYGGYHELFRGLDDKKDPITQEIIMVDRKASSPIHRHCFKTKKITASWGSIQIRIGKTRQKMKTVHLHEGQSITVRQGIWCQIVNPHRDIADLFVTNTGELLDPEDIIYAAGQKKKTDRVHLDRLFRAYCNHVAEKINPKRVFRPSFCPPPSP